MRHIFFFFLILYLCPNCLSEVPGGDYKNFRIHLDTRYANSTEPVDLAIEEFFPELLQYFEENLYYLREDGNMEIPCLNFKDGSCINTWECLIEIPEEHRIGGGGVDADFILYITNDHSPCTDNYYTSPLIWKDFCSMDNSTYRITSGYLNICTSAYNVAKPEDRMQLRQAIARSMLHMFGINTKTFYDVRKNITVFRDFTERETTVRKIVTPQVLQIVQDHFDCPGLNGAELEGTMEEGNLNSTLVYWEKRVFADEILTNRYSPDVHITKLSMALLDDIGRSCPKMYRADIDSAAALVWGKNRGCELPLDVCVQDQQTVPYCIGDNCAVVPSEVVNTPPQYVCSGYGQKGCHHTRVSKAMCTLRDWNADFIEPFRYYTRPYTGGLAMADACPVLDFFTYSGGQGSDCRYEENYVPTYDYSYAYGEIFGSNSYCFESTIFAIEYEYVLDEYLSACFHVECAPGSNFLRIHVGEENADTVICQNIGWVFLDGEAYRGYVWCPPSSWVCGATGRPACTEPDGTYTTQCQDHGFCFEGQCWCTSEGVFGVNCDFQYCPMNPLNSMCSGRGTCDYTTGECACDEDYYSEDCSGMFTDLSASQSAVVTIPYGGPEDIYRVRKSDIPEEADIVIARLINNSTDSVKLTFNAYHGEDSEMVAACEKYTTTEVGSTVWCNYTILDDAWLTADVDYFTFIATATEEDPDYADGQATFTVSLGADCIGYVDDCQKEEIHDGDIEELCLIYTGYCLTGDVCGGKYCPTWGVFVALIMILLYLIVVYFAYRENQRLLIIEAAMKLDNID
eukprot:Rmarinus@m.13952